MRGKTKKDFSRFIFKKISRNKAVFTSKTLCCLQKGLGLTCCSVFSERGASRRRLGSTGMGCCRPDWLTDARHQEEWAPRSHLCPIQPPPHNKQRFGPLIFPPVSGHFVPFWPVWTNLAIVRMYDEDVGEWHVGPFLVCWLFLGFF